MIKKTVVTPWLQLCKPIREGFETAIWLDDNSHSEKCSTHTHPGSNLANRCPVFYNCIASFPGFLSFLSTKLRAWEWGRTVGPSRVKEKRFVPMACHHYRNKSIWISQTLVLSDIPHLRRSEVWWPFHWSSCGHEHTSSPQEQMDVQLTCWQVQWHLHLHLSTISSKTHTLDWTWGTERGERRKYMYERGDE